MRLAVSTCCDALGTLCANCFGASLCVSFLLFNCIARCCIARCRGVRAAITTSPLARTNGSGRPALDASGPSPPCMGPYNCFRIFSSPTRALVCASASPCAFNASLSLLSSSVNSIFPDPNAGRPDLATGPAPSPWLPNTGRPPNAGRPNPAPVGEFAFADWDVGSCVPSSIL